MKHSSDTVRLDFSPRPHHLSPCSGRPGRSERSAHQRECPWFTSDPREHAADEEADGARAEEWQVQIQQQQGLRVHTHASLRHRSWSVCSLQVFEGRQRYKVHWDSLRLWKIKVQNLHRSSQIKSADDKAQKDKFAKGAKKSVEAGVYCLYCNYCLHIYVFCGQMYICLLGFLSSCVCFRAENQLNELEQRLAQTERMLNSILTQLDPLTNWWVMISVSFHALWFSTTPCAQLWLWNMIPTLLSLSLFLLAGLQSKASHWQVSVILFSTVFSVWDSRKYCLGNSASVEKKKKEKKFGICTERQILIYFSVQY